MPYILEEGRGKFQPRIDSVVQDLKDSWEDKADRAEALISWITDFVSQWDFEDSELARGDMNYIITEIVVWSMELNTAPKYDWANDVIGALDVAGDDLTDPSQRGILRCVQLELYRRLVSPYEDGKISSNGDIPAYSHLKEGSP